MGKKMTIGKIRNTWLRRAALVLTLALAWILAFGPLFVLGILISIPRAVAAAIVSFCDEVWPRFGVNDLHRTFLRVWSKNYRCPA